MRISIHAPRTGSDWDDINKAYGAYISIHAPRTGSDSASHPSAPIRTISIHAPRTGSDEIMLGDERSSTIFQSTLPARGATCLHSSRFLFPEDFNPRSPHGERPDDAAIILSDTPISIHAPRTGSDTYKCPDCGATVISIHAPRTGSDTASTAGTRTAKRFQSTLPARGATSRLRRNARSMRNFNPRSPHGERRFSVSIVAVLVEFQSTLPARGATDIAETSCVIQLLFQSTLPARGATITSFIASFFGNISIHAPRTGSDKNQRRQK